MSIKTEEILVQLKSLSLLEAGELVKQIEETFGVKASGPVPRCIAELVDYISVVGDEPIEAFDVVLEEVPADKKIVILKEIRTLIDLSLKEAKEFVESVPKVVKSAIARHVAEDVKKQLEAVGAKVSIK